MKERVKDLLAVVERFKGTPMLVIGDLIVDHYIWGKVDRISPEAPVVVVRSTEENKRLGGAGNVANNLIKLGASVSICGVVGDDNNGKSMVSMLNDEGIDTEGVLVDRSRQTTVKTRVIAHAQQVVRVDREDTNLPDAPLRDGIAKVLGSKLKDVKGVIVSDYAKGAISPELFEKVREGYAEGILGLAGVPVVVDPKAPNFSMYHPASVIKPNRAEAEAASGIPITNRDDAVLAGKKLLEEWGCELVLITLGEDGMVLVSQSGGETVAIDTVAREVYDVSGAGDTVSAVFALSLAAGATPVQAAELSNVAAGIVVAEVGTVAVTAEELISQLQQRGGK
ncbi:MAG: D-glycero-beta-D-manno-heptose-7-phosphate kinase [Bdellovibrionales bacterium]|nr:D-glycero-beta-D-manno-heptose-7-phosphate kinase [Bdellovibrionales bacterium]